MICVENMAAKYIAAVLHFTVKTSRINHFVRIPPWKFELKMHEAISEEVNRKLANKVVVNVGLVIALFDIIEIGDSHCLPGDGSTFTEVSFRCVVFRPLMDEVITGKIKSCSQEGVHVTLGFFDDIVIPPDSLLRPSRFDEYHQYWIWEYEDEHHFAMEKGDEIRFRVIGETFVDTTPSGPELGLEVAENAHEKKIPYSILGSINESGLGLPSWWQT